MIPRITPKTEGKFPSVSKKLPPKEVIITSKAGRDYISDVFIDGQPRYSVIETIKELFTSLFYNNHRKS